MKYSETIEPLDDDDRNELYKQFQFWLIIAVVVALVSFGIAYYFLQETSSLFTAARRPCQYCHFAYFSIAFIIPFAVLIHGKLKVQKK